MVRALLVIVFADADAEPGTVVVVSLHAVVADVAVNCAERTVNTAFDAIFLVDIEAASDHNVFMLSEVEMVEGGNEKLLLLPLVALHYLRQDPRVSVGCEEKS